MSGKQTRSPRLRSNLLFFTLAPGLLALLILTPRNISRVSSYSHPATSYTVCPLQFRSLGQRFYDLGHNVLIAPLPHHGLADRLTDEQALFSSEEMAAYADKGVGIARGPGDSVAMMGLSTGGVITSWAAQNRPDLDVAVIISPDFGYNQISTPLTAAALI